MNKEINATQIVVNKLFRSNQHINFIIITKSVKKIITL